MIQLAGAADKVIELIGMKISTAWRHEARGPHGEWVSGSGSSTTVIRSHSDLIAAAQQEDEIRRIAHEEAVKTATAQDIAYRQVHEAHSAKEHATERAQIKALQRQVREANIRVNKLAEQQEKSKAKTKSLAVISSLVGGAVLGGVEAKIGVPNLAAVISSILPATIESLFEWKKRL